MPRAAAFGLMLLVFLLVAPAFSAGYAVLALGPNPATVNPSEVIVGHETHPAIRPPSRQGLSLSRNLSIQASYNWSGYVIPSGAGSVTIVNGSWIEPSVSCSSPNSYAAFWVGIDGWNDGTVEQTGTLSSCQSGIPIYYAWYEFYPAGTVLISGITVNVGDVISASVSCQASGLQCTVSITDVSSGQSFSYTQTFGPGSGPQMSSADWIAEAPSSSSGEILPLANFGTINFGQDSTGVASTDSATVNGMTGPIGSFGEAVVEVTMVEAGGSIQAVPSALSPDGTSFSVAWVSQPDVADPVLSAGAITPASPTIDVGESIQLMANTSGGTPPYGITWYAAASAGTCSTSDVFASSGPIYTASPTANTYYCYVVTDSAYPSSSADSPTDFVTVNPALDSPAISVSPAMIGNGQSALVSTTATFTGGTSPFICQWLEEPPSAANFSELDSSFTTGCTPSSGQSASTGALTMSGTWAFELQVTDGAGVTVVSFPATLSVSNITGPVLTLSCSPSPVVVGSVTTCEAEVQGPGSSPTGRVAWSSNTPGEFSSKSCKLSKGACSVKFTPAAAGAFVGLLATYGGDSRNSPSAGAYVFTATAKTSKTTVSCTPDGVPAASPKTITCKAKVAGYLPTGTVAWSQGGTGSVSFSGVSTCTLSRGTCSVTMTGGAAGDLNVSASYAGDLNNAASYATANLTVTKAKTTLSVTCMQTSLVDGTPTTCIAIVSGRYSSRTGTVTWSTGTGRGNVTFSSETCLLSAGSCSVDVTASAKGKITIEAIYTGDPNNQGSSGHTRLTIAKAPTILALSCTGTSFSNSTSVTCTATVSGGYPSQTGTVTWSKVSGTGKVSFSSTICTLSSGSCSVTVTATASGSVEIKATYGGDSNNLKSSGTLALMIT